MTIKFLPEDKGVIIEAEDDFRKQLLSLLVCTVNGLNRVELQLEKLTEDKIDPDDGRLL